MCPSTAEPGVNNAARLGGPADRTDGRHGGPTQEEDEMQIAYLLVTLLCPVSMVAMVAWWAWAMRASKRCAAPSRSASDDAELTRMRAHLDQVAARSRDEQSAVRP